MVLTLSPHKFGYSGTGKSKNAYPTPFLVRVFDKFADYQRSKHSAESYEVGKGIFAAYGAYASLPTLEALPVWNVRVIGQ